MKSKCASGRGSNRKEGGVFLQVRKGLGDRKSKCRAMLSWSRREIDSIR